MSRKLAGIFLLAHHLGNARGHRHGGNAGRTDERVDLAAGQNRYMSLPSSTPPAVPMQKATTPMREDDQRLRGEEGLRR